MRTLLTIALAATSLAVGPVGLVRGHAAESYSPPVMRDSRHEPITFFGRLKSTGKWCSYDLKTWKRLVKQDGVIGDEFGWAHDDTHHLVSVTYFQQSEDAFAEDQYFIEPDGRVSRMVRTGGYFGDPIASVIFEPDPQRRLRLSSAGKTVVQKMEAAGYNPYFVDWDHFSALSQFPFAKLLSLTAGNARSAC